MGVMKFYVRFGRGVGHTLKPGAEHRPVWSLVGDDILCGTFGKSELSTTDQGTCTKCDKVERENAAIAAIVERESAAIAATLAKDETKAVKTAAMEPRKPLPAVKTEGRKIMGQIIGQVVISEQGELRTENHTSYAEDWRTYRVLPGTYDIVLRGDRVYVTVDVDVEKDVTYSGFAGNFFTSRDAGPHRSTKAFGWYDYEAAKELSDGVVFCGGVAKLADGWMITVTHHVLPLWRDGAYREGEFRTHISRKFAQVPAGPAVADEDEDASPVAVGTDRHGRGWEIRPVSNRRHGLFLLGSRPGDAVHIATGTDAAMMSYGTTTAGVTWNDATADVDASS